MEFTELDDGTILEIRVTEVERQTLRDMRKHHVKADSPECDYLDSLVALWAFFFTTLCTNKIAWIHTDECGDPPTDSPILGYRGGSVPIREDMDWGLVYVSGHWDGKTWYRPVLARWMFVSPAGKSLLVELLERGVAQLSGGYLSDTHKRQAVEDALADKGLNKASKLDAVLVNGNSRKEIFHELERDTLHIVRWWAQYADSHCARFGAGIGADKVLGSCWENMGRSIIGLLNNDIGGSDPCDLDAFIRHCLISEGFDPCRSDSLNNASKKGNRHSKQVRL